MNGSLWPTNVLRVKNFEYGLYLRKFTSTFEVRDFGDLMTGIEFIKTTFV